MNPSTATRARICRLLMRIKVCGSISEPPAGASPARRCGSVGPEARGRSSGGHQERRPFHVFQQAVDHGVDGHAVGLGPVAQEDAVPQGGVDQRADVLGRDVEPAREQGPGLRPQDQRLPGPQARAPAHPVVDEVGRLRPGRLAAASRTAWRTRSSAIGTLRTTSWNWSTSWPSNSGSIGFGPPRGRLLDDRHLVVLGQVVDDHVEHEPVELGLGERIGPLHLDRVLRGQDEERLLQRIAHAGRRHLVLLHRFQERGLGLGRRAVDLVGEDHVGEDRPLDELHPAPALAGLLEDLGPGDVGRHQVGRELDPLELEVEDLRDRADQQRLRQPGRAGDQAVAAGEEADQELMRRLLLADDHLRAARARSGRGSRGSSRRPRVRSRRQSASAGTIGPFDSLPTVRPSATPTARVSGSWRRSRC